MQINDYNDEQNAKGKPNITLKGIIVGNGVTDYNYDVWQAYVSTVYNFNLIPTKLRDEIVQSKCTRYFRDVLPGN